MPRVFPSKYDLYEFSVQSPREDIDFILTLAENVRGYRPVSLREDFCGSFRMCYEWVKRGPKNTALGLDIDPEPIAYGERTHLPRLTADERKRLKIARQDVLRPTREKVDLIIACNFSFCVFKDRTTLVRYFRACLQSLAPGGLLLLEAAGGPGMEETVKEPKVMKGLKGLKKPFTYIWDQKSFNPINRNGIYAIHYKVPGRALMKDVFTYDWRLWTLPEIREAMEAAGFKKSVIYWETTLRGKGTNEYIETEEGDNAWSWIAYPIGIKK